MDLDLFDDIDDAPKKVRVGAKFQPKAKPRPPKKSTPLVPSSQEVVTNEQSHEAEKKSYPDDQSNSGAVNPSSEQSYPDDQSNSGAVNPSSEHGVSTCNANSMVDSGPDIDVSIPEKNEDLQALFERSTGEDADIMIELDSLDFLHDSSSVLDNAFPATEIPAASNVPSDPVIQSVDDSGSLLHIPNVDSGSQISVAEDLLTENEFIVVEPVHNQQDMQSVPSGCGIVNQDSVTVLTDDNIPDSNAETLEEHIQTGPKAPKKLASRRAKKTKEGKTTASDQSSNPQGASSTTSNQTDTGSRVLRKRRNRDSSHLLVDEPEDDNALVDERMGSDSEFQPTNKPPEEKQKPGRKRKKDNKKSDETAEVAPKKFSRSTTKRRKVDKSLLENPDNIDVQKVSLMNLIRLAEHNERAAKKNEATASQAPPPNQPTVNHPARDNGFQEYDEGDDFAFEGPGYLDGEPIPMADENSGFFNYQTFMNKTRSAKWTEQDTELFYEGIQQFGTDFSMIQQLFLGRTRRQVKLKYKKEELKHPLRIREALMNRSIGHSHFDTVIERLRKTAAEEKKNDEYDDDSLNMEEGDVDESEAKNKEEEAAASAQVDHDQDVVDKEVEEEPVDEATVTEQAYDSEDELFKWSQYKSEL